VPIFPVLWPGDRESTESNEIQTNTSDSSTPRLHRALNLKDLVLLNIAAIVGLSSLAQVAQFGYGSLLMYVIAIFTFLIPSGLMVAELNALMPEEGGFYLWTRTAFGDLHGYVAAWSYWISTIVWLPTVLMLLTISSLYILGDDYLYLADNPWYSIILSLGILWTVTLLNIFGMERGKWIQNIGGVATYLTVILLLEAGVVFVLKYGSVHPFSAGKFIPDFGDFSVLPFFAIVAYCFGGLELAPVLAGEIQDPKRNIPRAIILTSVSVGLIYMVGTLMLIFTLPEGEVGIIEGVVQAFRDMSSTMHIPIIGITGTILVTVSTLGFLGSLMTGLARVPFVIGLNHYLPDSFGKIHPKWGSPVTSLVVQAVILSFLFLGSIAGSTITEAFLILLDMSIILYFIPFLYMFATLVWHKKHNTGGEGVIPLFQKSRAAVWIVTLLGFGVTLFSIIISSIPTKEIENRELFVIKVVGGAAFLIGVGLVVYYLKKRELHRSE
jgi:amino acid transporter